MRPSRCARYAGATLEDVFVAITSAGRMMLAALVRKETIELARDPITLAVAVVLPLVMLFLFGYGMSMDVKDTPLWAWRRCGPSLALAGTAGLLGGWSVLRLKRHLHA